MSDQDKDNRKISSETWSRTAKYYDPIKIGSIDGTDTEPHDKAILRAINSEYRPNKHVKGKPECTIFVARLNPKTTKDTIKDVFSKYGRLKRFRLVKDIVTGMPKGYAFIEYETERAAEDAYRKANKMNIDGQPIFVDFECERLLKGWKPRRLGGGFGGRKESGQLRFGGRDRPFHKPIDLEIHEQEQYEKERRSRDYRRDEHRNYKSRGFHDHHSHSRERSREHHQKRPDEYSEHEGRSRSRDYHRYERRNSSESSKYRKSRSPETRDISDSSYRSNIVNGKN